MRGNHAPNIFVSVLARARPGRRRAAHGTGGSGQARVQDGVAEINVGWRAHELKVNVSTDRQVYRVREKARVSVVVRRRVRRQAAAEGCGGGAGGRRRRFAGADAQPELEAAGDDDAAARHRGGYRHVQPCRWWATATTGARHARPAVGAGARPAASCSTRCCSGRRASSWMETEERLPRCRLNDSLTSFPHCRGGRRRRRSVRYGTCRDPLHPGADAVLRTAAAGARA